MSSVTKRVTNLKQLQSEIDSALSLIAHKSGFSESIGLPKHGLIAGTKSLLERCENIVNRKEDQRAVIRVVHNLGFGRDNIFAKCVAAMPNAFFLKEVHPNVPFVLRDDLTVLPTDILAQSKLAKVPSIDKLSEDLFRENLKRLNEHVNSFGGYLVVGYHSHADYFEKIQIPQNNKFKDLMCEYFNIRQVLIIRDPIDSYKFLRDNSIVDFEQQSFDEYCRRYLILLSQFEDDEILKYEDFYDKPSGVLSLACEKLMIGYDDSFKYILDPEQLHASDIAGSFNSKSVESLRSNSIAEEVLSSKHYQEICDLGWYRSVI